VLGSLARRRVHAVPYTPARRFAKGKGDPAFRTKLAIGADLAVRARQAGFAFRVVVADSAYGDQDGFRAELPEAGSVRDGTQAASRDLGLRPRTPALRRPRPARWPGTGTKTRATGATHGSTTVPSARPKAIMSELPSSATSRTAWPVKSVRCRAGLPAAGWVHRLNWPDIPLASAIAGILED
jgi:hypothetical protein